MHVAIDGDGKILVGGERASGNAWGVIRLDTAGNPDTTFGTGCFRNRRLAATTSVASRHLSNPTAGSSSTTRATDYVGNA
jgi:hypothetical protein